MNHKDTKTQRIFNVANESVCESVGAYGYTPLTRPRVSGISNRVTNKMRGEA